MMKVLMVDDEEHILHSYQRLIRRDYSVMTATSGQEALALLAQEGSAPPVIVSDFRMPGMNGAEFFAEVRKLYPDSFRILLTGYADFSETVSSINEGGIQRYLTKPCTPEVLREAIGEGEKAYHLRCAEHELLNHTLMGSLNMLVSILATPFPEVSKRAIRIADYVMQMAKVLGRDDLWQYQVAALMSQFAYIALPGEILNKHLLGEALTEEEEALVSAQPEVMQRLIRMIPRMGPVEAILQRYVISTDVPWKEVPKNNDALGALLIDMAQSYDSAASKHPEESGDWHVSRICQSRYVAEELLPVLHSLKPKEYEYQMKSLSLNALRVGMITADEVKTVTDMKLLSSGQVLTETMIEQLQTYDQRIAVKQPMAMHVPVLDISIEN